MDKRDRAKMLTGREVRRIPARLELRRVDGGIGFTGLASRTGVSYDMGWYDETMARGAFTTTLSQRPDLQFLVNHEGLPLARSTIADGIGSLTLREDMGGDTTGLRFDALCDGDDPDVARLAAKVDSGLMDQCSFAFRVLRQKWTWVEDDDSNSNERDQREIQEVSLDRGDVSIVNYGANPHTPVSTVRSVFDEMDAMSDAELQQFREDPTVVGVVRRLQIPVVVPVTTTGTDGVSLGAPATATNGPIAEMLSTDLALARAFALRQRRP